MSRFAVETIRSQVANRMTAPKLCSVSPERDHIGVPDWIGVSNCLHLECRPFGSCSQDPYSPLCLLHQAVNIFTAAALASVDALDSVEGKPKNGGLVCVNITLVSNPYLS